MAARKPAKPRKKPSVVKLDDEDEFMSDLLSAYKKWKSRSAREQNAGRSGDKQREYAMAFRVLLNKFSQTEIE